MAVPNVLTPSVYRVNPSSYTLSELYVDGVPLQDLNALYDLNTAALGAERWNAPNRFWATPPRLPSEQRRDALEVALNSSKKINHISFQISKFPLRAWLQYYNEKQRKWVPLRYRKTGKPARVNFDQAVPKRITRDVRGSSQQHPHHKAAGHWATVSIDLKPVNARRFRIILKQRNSKQGPLEVGTGKRIPFSLAIKDFQIGYKVAQKSDVINPGPGHTQVVEQAPTFSSTTDLLGSSVEMVLTEYRASDMLWPTLQAQSGVPVNQRDSKREVWKCEPQPIPTAVVNLYLDARDAKGDNAPVDKFFIDPTTSGPSVNIYYSNDDFDLSQGFAASDESLRYPGLRLHGSVEPYPEGIGIGVDPAAPGSTFGWMDIDNQMIQFRQEADWWAGLRFQPTFTSEMTSTRTVYATPNVLMQWNGTEGSWDFNIDGVLLRRDDVTFGALATISVVIVRKGARVFVYMSDGWSASGDAPIRGRLTEAVLAEHPEFGQFFRFGADLVDEDSIGRGEYFLNGFVLKQETVGELVDGAFPQAVTEFFSVPIDTYVIPSTVLDEDDEPAWDYTANALIRISPALQGASGSRNRYGVIGGPGTNYENLTWTPINRDFRLHRGYYNFDPVQAKFFKFEFTNLVAQPYSSIEPTVRKVKLFTADVRYLARRRLVIRGVADTLPGVNVGQAHSEPLFSDQYRIGGVRDINRYYANYKPTEALVASDPVAQERLARINPAFGMVEWRASAFMAPRQTQTKKHYYEVVQVRHASNVAYFVGLNEIRMFRTEHTSANDTDAYNFPFFDRDALDDAGDANPWSLGTFGGLISDGTGTIQTTSKALPSRRNVRGVQFAAHQTRPTQLLADPEFIDQSLTYWDPYGGAAIEQTDDITSDIGSSVKVTRAPQGSFWYYMEVLYPTWDAIDAADKTWDEFEASTDTEQSYGGITGSPESYVQPAAGGRVHVAARVYANQALESPLKLQLIDIDGNVLSEQDAMPKVGGVTEWFTSYTVGESGAIIDDGPTWDDVEDLSAPDNTPWDDLDLIGTWDDVTGGTISPYEGPMTARLVQSNPTLDQWYVDNISIFEDPIVWEFSNDDGDTWYPAYDIRNNPHGVLVFPTDPEALLSQGDSLNLRWRVTSYRPNQRVSSLVIRPWYATLPLGIPSRETIAYGGPNVSKYDQYPSIEDHAPFKAWHRPIPEDWWFLYRQWLLQGGITNLDEEQGNEQVTEGLVLSSTLVYQGKPLPQVVLGESVLAFGTSTILGEGIVTSSTITILGTAFVI